jgi:hypothetical protein
LPIILILIFPKDNFGKELVTENGKTLAFQIAGVQDYLLGNHVLQNYEKIRARIREGTPLLLQMRQIEA